MKCKKLYTMWKQQKQRSIETTLSVQIRLQMLITSPVQQYMSGIQQDFVVIKPKIYSLLPLPWLDLTVQPEKPIPSSTHLYKIHLSWSPICGYSEHIFCPYGVFLVTQCLFHVSSHPYFLHPKRTEGKITVLFIVFSRLFKTGVPTKQ
jgi:hypothetical protein